MSSLSRCNVWCLEQMLDVFWQNECNYIVPETSLNALCRFEWRIRNMGSNYEKYNTGLSVISCVVRRLKAYKALVPSIAFLKRCIRIMSINEIGGDANDISKSLPPSAWDSTADVYFWCGAVALADVFLHGLLWSIQIQGKVKWQTMHVTTCSSEVSHNCTHACPTVKTWKWL